MMSTEIPVYLVTGFLEGGKTTFLNFTIGQEYFQIPELTLLIACEEGEVEYDEGMLHRNNTVLEIVEEPEDFTFEYLKGLAKKYHPGRVLLEFNPLWSVAKLEEMQLPAGWEIAQQIVIVDASCFQIYMNNLKSLFVEMTRNAELVIFNRCDPQKHPLANFRRGIKVNNPGCEIQFEDCTGNLIDIFEDEMPYDLEAPVVEIDDVDYGIFYVDMEDHPERYQGKTVRFKGKVLKSKLKDANYFVPARKVMTCCADDTTMLGFLCEYEKTSELKTGQWVQITAKVTWKYMKSYRGKGPVYEDAIVEFCEAPQDEMVYFN